jgi:hypothetical protein
MGPRFMDQLDRASRFQYLLGYSPANPELDGKFRNIQVRVNRRDVRVFHRQGYFARRASVGLTPALILGLRLTGTLEASAVPRTIKVVVYDPAADLAGTAVVTLR